MHYNVTISGVEKESIYEKATNAYIMLRAGASTVPFEIDDPAQKKNLGNDLNDVIVDLYNRNQSATLCKGVKHPKSIPIIATNYALHQEER